MRGPGGCFGTAAPVSLLVRRSRTGRLMSHEEGSVAHPAPGCCVAARGCRAVGAAGSAGCWSTVAGDGDRPRRAAAPGRGRRRPAAALKPSTYRLQPLTGYGPPRAAPRRTLVRRAPLLRVSGRGRTMVLTFDDGPDPRYTPHILDTLRRVRRARDVLRVRRDGRPQQGARWPGWPKRAMSSATTPGPIRCSPGSAATGSATRWSAPATSSRRPTATAPSWFRAPYGAWNRTAFRLGAELGMEPLAWTVDTLDWTTPGTQHDRRPGRGRRRPRRRGALARRRGRPLAERPGPARAICPQLLDSGYHVTVPRAALRVTAAGRPSPARSRTLSGPRPGGRRRRRCPS